jgi:hypothetical protein
VFCHLKNIHTHRVGMLFFTSSPDPYHPKHKVLQRIKRLSQRYFK